MKIVFQDLQQIDNPMNGMLLETAEEVTRAFRSLAGRKPFLFELRGEYGFMLTVGFADNQGSVQYSPSSGMPTYMMAIADSAENEGEFIEFLAGNTPTPISRRYCLPIKQVETIVLDFLASGAKSEAVPWEEI